MTSNFSGAIQLIDLDDFITPSQECIKPVQANRLKASSGAKIKIQDGIYEGVGIQSKQLQKVEISLNDCLACSGCITSAEGVLINQQNFNEIIKIMDDNKLDKEKGDGKLVVVSLALQPIVSLSHKHEVTPEQVARKLATFFKNLGADYVLDISNAEDMTLLETQLEFIQRYRSKNTARDSLPMLASSCPGWICYAEKTHGNFILPYISTTKSPQQIMGSLVKYHLGKSPDRIYHFTLMPCYDKKLEASRNEFFNASIGAKDVDCVITTVELEQFLGEQNISLRELPETDLDYPWGRSGSEVLSGHFGSSSGGFAHHVLKHAACEILELELTEMDWKTGKNPDLKELVVENKESGISLRFAIANGFRNIQNIVQKIKRGNNIYDYIEIMACPSGCLNGGAQIKPPVGDHVRDVLGKLEEVYARIPRTYPEENGAVQKIYKDWLDGPGSDKCSAFLHTQYRLVEKTTTALNIKW